MTVSNTPSAVAGEQVFISGSARYSALPFDVAGGRVIFTLPEMIVTNWTTSLGTFSTNFAPLSAGTYTIQVCVTDFSLTTCTNFIFAVTPPAASNQTITFPVINDQVSTGHVGLTATASSGLPVSFAVASGPAIIGNGTNLTFSGTGSVSIVAQQSGNALWHAAPNITNSFMVVEPSVPLLIITTTTLPTGAAMVDYYALLSVTGGVPPYTWSVSEIRVAGAWSNNQFGQVSGAAGRSNLLSIAGGTEHCLGLQFDGTVNAWGANLSGRTSVPTGLSNVTGIAAGQYHSAALKSDGTVVVWGDNGEGQLNVPAGLSNVVAIAGGGRHTLALKSNGTVAAWGGNLHNQSIVPTGLTGVVAVAAGQFHSLALRTNGTVVAWGYDGYGAFPMPAGLSGVVAIAAGGYHSLALKTDGAIIRWGTPYLSPATEMPTGLTGVVALAGGQNHSLALKSDGSVVAWGNNAKGQCDVPAELTNVEVIAGSGDCSLVLRKISSLPAGINLSSNGEVSGLPTVAATTQIKWIVRDSTGATTNKTLELVIQSDMATPPTAIAATNVSANGFSANWNTIASATNYMLDVSSANSFVDFVAGYSNLSVGSVLTRHVTGLSPGQTYYYRVRAQNGIGISGSSSTITVTTAKSDQSITFPPIGNQTVMDTVGLAATASSGLPVSFAVGSGPAVIAGGTNLSFTGAGTVEVVASQSGDTTWNAAPDVTHTFAVSSDVALISTTYVSPSGEHIPPFSSWATSATNIQDAINVTAPGGLVLVSNGVYDIGGAAAPGSMVSNRVLVGPGIRLESVNGPENTIIVGAPENIFQNAWPVRGVYLSTGASIVGFTITNGHTRNVPLPDAPEGLGGGVYAESNGTVEGCVISGCFANSGGGAANADLIDCRLVGNTAHDTGGGSYLGSLLRCRVENNVAHSVGGGIAYPTLAVRCWVQGNQAVISGGGIYGDGSMSAGSALHCVVIGNSAQWGGGVSGDSYHRFVVRNCTIVDNHAQSSGGGIGYADVYDSIVYYNSAPSASNYESLPQGSVIAPEDGPFVFSTNAPGIVSLANPRLLASSIAIDADTDPTIPAVDFDGDTRPQGAAEDLGADEFNTASLTGPISIHITASSSSVLAGQHLSFEVEVGGLPIGYSVDFDDGTTLSDLVIFSHVFDTPGMYNVVAIASNHSGSVSATTTVSVLEGGAAITYVSLSGSHTPPFASWSTAATNLQDGVDAAAVGGLVLVSDGVYNTGSRSVAGGPLNRVVIDKNVHVKSANGPTAAIIRGAWSGPGTNSVRTVFLGAGAMLSGFTIEGGSVDTEGFGPSASLTSGGGIYAASSSHLVSNCVIRNNRSFLGAGAAFANLVQSRVESNSATYGGGLYGGTADRCDIVKNTAGMEGGGALSPVSITRSRISGNIAGWAGGGLVSADNVIGCLISGNWSRRAGGALNSTMRRCTVSGNSAQNFAGGMQGGSAVDSIIFHNTTTISANHLSTSLANCYTVPAPSGNFSADPMLVSPLNGRLLAGSPCIDSAGGPSGLTTDLDGDPLPLGAAEDIGADEFNGAATSGPLSIFLAVSTVQVLAGNSVTFSIEIEGIASGISLDLGDGQTVASQSIVSHVYHAGGTYTATAKATNSGFIATAAVTVQVSAANTILYVAPGGGHIAPFANWVNASTSIQAAVDIAPEGATVLVSNGVYVSGGRHYPGTALSNVVIATNGVHIRSVNGPEVTIIGHTNVVIGRGVFLGAGSSLSGFTVRNFKSRPPGNDIDLEMSGGGILCAGPDIYVRHCIIKGNRAEAWGGGLRGGIVEDSLIVSNSAGYSIIGGGGGAEGSSLYRCQIAYNAATSSKNGGGLYGGSAVDSIFEHNTAYDGGGAAHSTLTRCILRQNTAIYRGGGSLSATLINCLVHNNTAANSGGGAKFGTVQSSTIVANQGGGASQLQMTNSILYGNSPSNYDTLNTVRHSCIVPLPSGGANNIDADPMFLNAAAGDYRLATNSPCINAGTNLPWMATDTDLDGNPRIQQDTVDMGAYEYPSYTTFGVRRSWLRVQELPDDGTADDIDFDGDGFNIFEEWLTGTNPFDANSTFILNSNESSSLPEGSTTTLLWPYQSGRIYTIYWSDSPLVGTMVWSSLVLNEDDYTVEGGTAAWTDNNIGPNLGDVRVYRISVRNP